MTVQSAGYCCRADEVAVEEDVKHWCATVNAKGEKVAGAKLLCIPLEQPELPEGTLCIASGKPARYWCRWGKTFSCYIQLLL